MKRLRDVDATSRKAVQKCWLMKSEPDVFSISDLEKKGTEHWDGVRNYAARNNMQAMSVGDLVMFYHSNGNPSGAAGLATVCRSAYPDHTAWDKKSKYYDPKSSRENPRWQMVDVKHLETFPRLVSLAELKTHADLQSMMLFSHGRLSVQPLAHESLLRIAEIARR